MVDNNFSITIKMDSLAKKLNNFPVNASKGIQLSLQQSALVVQNKAKTGAPYKTGNLRRSITNIVKKGYAKVGTNVIYARVREFSTRNKPNGYLRPALALNKTKIQKIFQTTLSKLLFK